MLEKQYNFYNIKNAINCKKIFLKKLKRFETYIYIYRINGLYIVDLTYYV